MPGLSDDEYQARDCGLALLDASRIYDGFVVPSREGKTALARAFPPHRRAIIGLVGRQRRFLRAAYTLADDGQMLEAMAPLRSLFECLVTQRWLADDPARNWKLWMKRDHDDRALWRERLRQRAPQLHDAAAAAQTEANVREGAALEAARQQLAAEVGDQRPTDLGSLERRAEKVGLGFLYDSMYRYESNAAVHPTMFSIDLLFEPVENGLQLHGEPTDQFHPLPVYLLGADLLHLSLAHSGELTPKLRLPELAVIAEQLHTLSDRRTSERFPGWRDLLPEDFLGQRA